MSKSNMYTTNIATKRGINVGVIICLVLVWKANTPGEGSSSGEYIFSLLFYFASFGLIYIISPWLLSKLAQAYRPRSLKSF